jgi:hypothetical protein
MKIRIQGHANGLRLNCEEVTELAGAGRILEAVEFAPAGLFYVIEVDAKIPAVAALYHRRRITLRLPQGRAREWIEMEPVGLDGEQTLGGKMSRILTQNDFQCLHFQCLHTGKGREDEIAPEDYPNPSADTNRQKAG